MDLQQWIIVEIALLNAAILERGFGFQCCGETEYDAAFDLGHDVIVVDDLPAVHRRDHSRQVHLLHDGGFPNRILGDGKGLRCDYLLVYAHQIPLLDETFRLIQKGGGSLQFKSRGTKQIVIP